MPSKGQLLRRIVQELAVRGGMTANELADLLEVDVLRIRPRLWDLRRSGRVRIGATKRRYKEHRRSYVFVASPHQPIPKAKRRKRSPFVR